MKSWIKKLLYPYVDIHSAQDRQCCSLEGALENGAFKSQLRESLQGDIVFDSRRSKYFSIYKLGLDTDIEPICQAEAHLIYPDVCAYSGSIVFARTDSLARTAPADVWIKEHDKKERLLCQEGTFPTFSNNGQVVYFEKNRKQLWQVSLTDGNAKLLFAGVDTDFGDFAVVKPRVSPDSQHVIFTSDKGGRWNLWCVNLLTGAFHHVVKGCEAVWFPDSRNTAWIKKYGLLDFVGIYSIDGINPGQVTVIEDRKSGLGHEYFPFITDDGRYILYSACPMFEHDHNTSAYQLFAKDLSSSVVTRLTFDKFTNRWPKFLPIKYSS